MFNYKKTYYKVTNKQECHNGYQYHDGLNLLPDVFNDDPKDSCVKGGFYFTDYEHLCDFFGFGTYIREVTIPEDALVAEDCSGDKWRANAIILGKKYHIKNDFAQWFDPNKFNWEYSYILPKNYPKQFDIWWNSDKFSWKYSYLLAKYCSKHFDKWFDPDKYNWADFDYLLKYCLTELFYYGWFDDEMLNELISKIKAKKNSKYVK